MAWTGKFNIQCINAFLLNIFHNFLNRLPITWPNVPRCRDGAFHFFCVPLGLSSSQAQGKHSVRTCTLTVGCMSEQAERRGSEWQLSVLGYSSSGHSSSAWGRGGRLPKSHHQHESGVWFPVRGSFTGVTTVSCVPLSCSGLATTVLTSKSGIPSANIWNLFSVIHPPKCTQVLTQGFPIAGWDRAFFYLYKEDLIKRRVNGCNVVCTVVSSADQLACELQVEMPCSLFEEETPCIPIICPCVLCYI